MTADLAVALVDGVTGCLFFAAAVVAAIADGLAASRTKVWRYLAAAFGLMAVERMMNALEWGAGASMKGLDTVEGYFAGVACLILAGLAISFTRLARRPPPGP